jgi:anti-sigma factor RsiW
MHLDDETIQRWIHGELDPDAKRTASAHLTECADCRQRLAHAELEDQWIRRRFELMDHPVPAVSPSAIFRARRASLRLRWAAGILLTCTVAGAAYAAPGSPLPRWLHRARVWVSGPVSAVPTIATPPAITSGISVPIEPRLVIHFAAPQTAGVLRVALVDTGSVAIRVTNGVASLSSAPGALGVANRGSLADYEIDIPRASPWIDIDVGGKTLLQKRDSLIRTGVTLDSAGHYVLPLTTHPDH